MKKQFLKSTFFAACIGVSFFTHTAQRIKASEALAGGTVWIGCATLWAYNASPKVKHFFDSAAFNLKCQITDLIFSKAPQSGSSRVNLPQYDSTSTPDYPSTDASTNDDKRAVDAIEEALSKMPIEKIIELLIAKEKSQLVRGILENVTGAHSTASSAASAASTTKEENKEAHFFEPRMPKPLLDEEKNKSATQAISEKYIGNVPNQIADLIFYFTHHKECMANNVGIWNRLLLHGKPGMGKSHLVKVLAQELQVPLLSFSASFFPDKYIGEASRKLRKVFDIAIKLNQPVLIFIDHIDAIATKRTLSTPDEYRKTLATLSTELQAIQNNKNIFFIAATNDLQSLDLAVIDRFSGSICEIKALATDQRAKLLMKLFADNNLPADFNLAKRLAEITDDKFSNRELGSIVIMAKHNQFQDQIENPQAYKKHLCTYLKQVLRATGKECSFRETCPSGNILLPTWLFANDNGEYCDGI